MRAEMDLEKQLENSVRLSNLDIKELVPYEKFHLQA